MIIEIYANYGLLGAEKRRVYSIHPLSDIHDKIKVKIPKDWEVWRNGPWLIAQSPWGWQYDVNDILKGDKQPIFRVLNEKKRFVNIKLEEV